jgi:hypothetical protein
MACVLHQCGYAAVVLKPREPLWGVGTSWAAKLAFTTSRADELNTCQGIGILLDRRGTRSGAPSLKERINWRSRMFRVAKLT